MIVSLTAQNTNLIFSVSDRPDSMQASVEQKMKIIGPLVIDTKVVQAEQ